MGSGSCSQHFPQGCRTGISTYQQYQRVSKRDEPNVFQPAFVNNPLTGLIILAGLFVFEPTVGLGCMLGGLTATVVELLVGLHPWADLANGVACFNGVLVGTVIPILYPATYGTDRSLAMWLAVAGGSIVRWYLITILSASRAFNNHSQCLLCSSLQ